MQSLIKDLQGEIIENNKEIEKLNDILKEEKKNFIS